MLDIIYRYDPYRKEELQPPATVEEAQRRLEDGNRRFAQILEIDPDAERPGPTIIPFRLEDMGYAASGDSPKQSPFAIVLGCSDARVPVEMIYSEGCNNLFVVRVAGNVLGAECLGSIDYAVQNFRDSLKIVVIMGHSGCGAVTAAVEAFLNPANYLAIASSHPLRAIVDRVLLAVRAADESLKRTYGGSQVTQRPGYRKALIEASVTLNAALTASAVQRELVQQRNSSVRVCFTVYELKSRVVRVPVPGQSHRAEDAVGLACAPVEPSELAALASDIAASDYIADLLA